MCHLKKLSGTRWSARSDASISLNNNWNEIINALSFIKNDKSEKSITRSEANGLYLKLDCLETAIMATLWGDILERFNKTSKQLQSVEIDLETVVCLYESLIRYVLDLRSMFDIYEERAINKSGHKTYQEILKRKRKLTADEKRVGEINFEIRDSLRINTYYAIIDNLHSELERRKFYYDECIQFRSYLMSLSENIRPKTVMDICKMIGTEKLQELLPYVDIALRMYLCCPTSNCSAERSFSALKRVKSYLRSRMTDSYSRESIKTKKKQTVAIQQQITDSFETSNSQNQFHIDLCQALGEANIPNK
ncbi:uncharacterized protein LOC103308262 [Acyrthosiphon pisum]|uniref:HAT C-terminal dimerisation domain-containing protein n=1 Tax=Acyrthosiphon pisum TaxID=7029 RepID=A0A8R2B3J8_ACYPI|nr:uncharacterized protein LOC103308262 [Acyrthosiphon pisum]|eukprot:XP_008179576.1 PREDICTED: uncharacterized protein LOC103308262 [Acyrthosiphon pisum]